MCLALYFSLLKKVGSIGFFTIRSKYHGSIQSNLRCLILIVDTLSLFIDRFRRKNKVNYNFEKKEYETHHAYTHEIRAWTDIFVCYI